MISYEPLWKTMEAKGYTTYTLRVIHGLGGGTVQRLQKNESVSTNTLNDLCQILNCTLAEIAVYIEDDTSSNRLVNQKSNSWNNIDCI